LPTTFEERKGLLLLKGAFLGPEQQITFAKKKPDSRNRAKTGPERTNVPTADHQKCEVTNASMHDKPASASRLYSPVLSSTQKT